MGDDVHHPQLLQVVERLLPPEFLGKVWERCHEPRTLQETRLVIAALLNKQERLQRVRPVTSKIAPAVTTTTLATAVRPRRPPKSKAPEEQANAATEHRTTTTPRAPQPATRPIRPCLFCTSAEHSTTGCTEHSTVAQREERLRVLNRCPRCLASAHQTEECNVRRAPCYICQQLGHHPALCPERQHTRSPRTTQVAAVSVSQPEAFLPLASVRVHNGLPTSPTATPWILLDACSESNFISTELATRLQLTATEATTMTIGTMGERSHTVYAERYTVYLRQDDGSDKAVQCWAVDTLLQPLRHVENASAKVEMLLGIDTYFDVVHGCPQRLPSGLYQVDTTLGTLTCGKQDDTYRVQVAHISLLDKQEAALDQLLERQWGLDAIGIVDDPHEIDDDRALALLNASVTRDGEGRYHVSLPRRPVPSQFGDNFGLAYARLVSVARQLQGHDAESWTTYAAIIRQQLDAGIIEQVNERVPDNTVRYIPHHMVFGKKKRIVYDASARQGKSGSSLNDMLYRGPLLLHNLAGILLRSRLSRLLISADVEKAFLMIGIHETDRDLLRFVFLKDPSRPPTRDNIQIYRFCRLPFGLNCAPFVLNAVVRHHLATSGSPLAAVIANDIYADNIFLRVDTQAEATQHCATAKQLFADACMNLREFRSNNAAVNTAFSDPESPTTIKVLGIEWDSAADAFSIPFPPRDNMPATKQSVCSFIAKVYDPLGWVSPTLVAARQILQYLHQSEYSWTTALTATDQARWNRVMEPLDAYRYTIPRYPGSFNETATLHIFCDASKHHYATAAYLVLSTAPPCLLMAKSRIVPVSMKCSDQKRFAFITIPRLELMALHLGSMLLRFLRQELPAIQNAVIWTDSTPALGWVHSAPETVLPVFVDNRVRVIREVRVPVRYVPTACNPADIATRGLTPSQLSESTLWHHGPAWLAQPQSEWPAQPNISVTAVTTLSPADDFTIVDLNASNRLLTLVRAQALAHRAAARFLRQRATTPLMRNIQAWSANVAELTTEELAAARQALLTQAQQAFPPADKYRRCLQADAHGILRYLSRLTNSELKQATTHPAFLDPRSPLATLMVLQIHDDLHHSGIITTHNELRQTLWIPQGRRLVHQLLRKCVPCRRRTAAPFTAPPMPDLPPSRVTQARPFEHSGLDYFGPCHVRLPNSSQYSSKCWVALFTCLTTRAVHLEPVLSSSGAACLAAFRRFIARRGRPTTMLSDNATAFVLVARLVERVWPVTELPLEATNTLQRFCADKGIRWSHITAHAPWQGGAWERLVGVVKNPLKATLGRQLVDFDEFVTLLTEVEQVVNLRPLVMGSTIEDHPLRPIDFLMPMGVPSPIALELPRTVTDTTTASELIALWQSSEDALNVFWKEFHAGYLLQLRDRMDRTLRQPRSQTGRRPIVDEVVLIRDDAVPRNQWRLGRICALDQSTDGEIRSVGVQLASGHVVHRPVAKLAPLEFSVHTDVAATPPSVLEPLIEQPSDNMDEAPPSSNTPLATPVAGRSTRYDLRPLPRRDYTYATLLQTAVGITALPTTTAFPLDSALAAPASTFITTILETVGYSALLGTTLLLCLLACAFVLSVCSPVCTALRCVVLVATLPWKCLVALFRHCRRQRNRYPLRRIIFTLLALLGLVGEGARGCGNSGFLSSYGTSCSTSNGITRCHHTGSARIVLRDVGQTQCVLLKDTNDSTRGVVSIQLQQPNLMCTPRRLFTTTPYKTATSTVQRCPFTGSCVMNRCVRTTSDDVIPELDNVKLFPGYNACMNGPEWPFNGCGLPSPSCLFYRVFALNTDDSEPFTVFRCDEWHTRLQLRLVLPGENGTHVFQLHEGVPLRHNNVTLTLVRGPPSPTQTLFLARRKQQWALIDDVETIRLRGQSFQPHCDCHAAEATINCLCHPDPENPFAANKLPVAWLNHWLYHVRDAPAIRLAQATIEVELRLDEAHLDDYHVEADCQVTASHVTGRLGSSQDATTNITCAAPQNVTAAITCDHEAFVVTCGPKQPQTQISFAASDPTVARNCVVRCGERIIPLLLRGTLVADDRSAPTHNALYYPAPPSTTLLLFFNLLALLIIGAVLLARRQCHRQHKPCRR